MEMIKRYCIFTLGCQMNKSDSERIATIFDSFNFKETNLESLADFIVVNACAVRQKAVDRIYGKIKNWQKLRKKNPNLKIILTGCVLKEDREKFNKRFDFIFDIGDFESLREFIIQVCLSQDICLPAGKQAAFIRNFNRKNYGVLAKNFSVCPAYLGDNQNNDYFKIIPKYRDKKQALVPIMTGCNNFCAYCVVPYTRGRERSRPMEDILSEIKNLVKKGYQKIVLLGQNVSSFQISELKSQISKPKSDFVTLLEKISKIPGDFVIEFLTSHPKDIGDDLIQSFAELPKLAPKLHLALQSGDNRILHLMNRKYTREQFRGLVAKIRRACPDIFLSTDIIVGYPSETKKQFASTVSLCKELKFDKAYIALYSPRAGTEAARLKDNVSPEEKKRRWKILDNLINKKFQTQKSKLQIKSKT